MLLKSCPMGQFRTSQCLTIDVHFVMAVYIYIYIYTLPKYLKQTLLVCMWQGLSFSSSSSSILAFTTMYMV